MYNPHSNESIFKDFLFNLLLVFIVLLALLLMLPKEPSKAEQDITTKAEFVIQMEWDSNRNIDVDLWVKDPMGDTIYFSRKKGKNVSLELDDLGDSSDKVFKLDGSSEVIKINEEVVSIRGINPGEYTVNAHIYNKFNDGISSLEPLAVRVKVLKLNPFRKVFEGERIFTDRGEEQTFINFFVNEDGYVMEINEEQKEITHFKSVDSDLRDQMRGIHGPNYN